MKQSYTRKYPLDAARILVERIKGLTDAEVEEMGARLNSQAKREIGDVSIFNIVGAAEEFLQQHNRQQQSLYEIMIANRGSDPAPQQGDESDSEGSISDEDALVQDDSVKVAHHQRDREQSSSPSRSASMQANSPRTTPHVSVQTFDARAPPQRRQYTYGARYIDVAGTGSHVSPQRRIILSNARPKPLTAVARNSDEEFPPVRAANASREERTRDTMPLPQSIDDDAFLCDTEKAEDVDDGSWTSSASDDSIVFADSDGELPDRSDSEDEAIARAAHLHALSMRSRRKERISSRSAQSSASDGPVRGERDSRFAADFELLRALGRGGFGQVFQVRNKLDGNLYAVKLIPIMSQEAEERTRILREVKSLAKLMHQNVVRFYHAWIENGHGLMLALRERSQVSSMKPSDSESMVSEKDIAGVSEAIAGLSRGWGDSGGSDSMFLRGGGRGVGRSGVHGSEGSYEGLISMPGVRESGERDRGSMSDDTSEDMLGAVEVTEYLFIQMEYCDKTLEEVIENAPLDEAARWRIVRQLLDGLAHIHSRGIIHRDLKPANVFFTQDGTVRIGDFGLSSEVGAAPDANASDGDGNETAGTNRTSRVGTALYAAPEQVGRTDYDEKADMYALGVTLLALWNRWTTYLESAIMVNNTRRGEPPATLDPKAAKLVALLLREDPAQRPGAQELLSSSLLPPREEEAMINDTLRYLRSRDNELYERVVAELFELARAPAASETPHGPASRAGRAPGEAPGMWSRWTYAQRVVHTSITNAAKAACRTVFRSRAATEVAPAWAANGTAQRRCALLARDGTGLTLAHDAGSSLLAAACASAERGSQARLFAIGSVWRGSPPRRFDVAEFVIVGSALAPAAVADVAAAALTAASAFASAVRVGAEAAVPAAASSLGAEAEADAAVPEATSSGARTGTDATESSNTGAQPPGAAAARAPGAAPAGESSAPGPSTGGGSDTASQQQPATGAVPVAIAPSSSGGDGETVTGENRAGGAGGGSADDERTSPGSVAAAIEARAAAAAVSAAQGSGSLHALLGKGAHMVVSLRVSSAHLARALGAAVGICSAAAARRAMRALASCGVFMRSRGGAVGVGDRRRIVAAAHPETLSNSTIDRLAALLPVATQVGETRSAANRALLEQVERDFGASSRAVRDALADVRAALATLATLCGEDPRIVFDPLLCARERYDGLVFEVVMRPRERAADTRALVAAGGVCEIPNGELAVGASFNLAAFTRAAERAAEDAGVGAEDDDVPRASADVVVCTTAPDLGVHALSIIQELRAEGLAVLDAGADGSYIQPVDAAQIFGARAVVYLHGKELDPARGELRRCVVEFMDERRRAREVRCA